MSSDPALVLSQLFEALDRKDGAAIVALMGPEVVMVDEISRRWLRGVESVSRQIDPVLAATSSLQSRLSGVHCRLLGSDAALVTGWLDQTYRLDGQERTISAPLSACLEASAGAWRLISLHAIPL